MSFCPSHRRRRVSCGLGGVAAGSDNDIDLELHQLTCQQGKPVDFPLGESPLEDEIPAVNVAQFAQGHGDKVRCGRNRGIWDPAGREDAHAVQLPPLLRPSGERRKSEADSENDREPDQRHEPSVWDGWRESNRRAHDSLTDHTDGG